MPPCSSVLQKPGEGDNVFTFLLIFSRKMKKIEKTPPFPLAKPGGFLYKVFRRAEVAQLVEQGTENPRVGSSILSLGTMNQKKGL